MDTFDFFLPNTDSFQPDTLPSDLYEVEPLLSDSSMDISEMLGLNDFSLSDFTLNSLISEDNFFSEPSDGLYTVKDSPRSSKSSTLSDCSSEKSLQHSLDLVNFDHTYAATPLSHGSEHSSTSSDHQISENSYLTRQDTCYVGVDDESASFFDGLLNSDIFKTNKNDVMWSSYLSSRDSNESFVSDLNDTENETKQIRKKTEHKFHETSINELAKKQVEAELPNFRPIKLTDEEKALLVEEGVQLPEDLPLTKSEEKVLKRVRRKIRNKRSAKVSRQKKKDYIEGLESQISESNGLNQTLSRRVDELQKQNATLKTQLRRLMAYVQQPPQKTTQATSCLLVVLLAIGLFLTPNTAGPGQGLTEGGGEVPDGHRTRRVLEYNSMTEKVQQSYFVQWYQLLMKRYNSNNRVKRQAPEEPLTDLLLNNKLQEIVVPDASIQTGCKNSTLKNNSPTAPGAVTAVITLSTSTTITTSDLASNSSDNFLKEDKNLNLQKATFVQRNRNDSTLTR